jgi:hypothetical protein
MARLSARQLKTVIERASLLKLQKRKVLLSARESDLLRTINCGLSAEKSARLELLERKLQQEIITRPEQVQLLRLTDELERLGAQRLEALIELAAVRKTSVARLMREMGLAEAGYG